MKVLFVCTGNVARSVMAEAILKDMDKGHEVQSAGQNPNPGTPPHINTKNVLQNNNLSKYIIDKTSQVVTPELLEWADIVLTMEFEQARFIYGQERKVSSIKSYLNDIIDPTDTGSLETFQEIYLEIKEEVFRIFA